MMSNISHIILHVDIPTMLSDAIFSDRLFVLIFSFPKCSQLIHFNKYGRNQFVEYFLQHLKTFAWYSLKKQLTVNLSPSLMHTLLTADRF